MLPQPRRGTVTTMMTINELVKNGSKILAKKGNKEAALEAQVLLADELKCDRLKLIVNYDMKAEPLVIKSFNKKIKLRASGVPLSYVTGKKEFMDYEFKVSSDVLVPRPETETLVETTLKIIKTSRLRDYNMIYILDIGSGSGNIAVSLAKLVRNAIITGIDVSNEALKIARVNAKALHVGKKVDFRLIDLFSKKLAKLPKYDLIVTNPPYVTSGEYKKLQKEIHHEPREALLGGKDGLEFYDYMSKVCSNHLNKNGVIIMETGYNQAEKVLKIFQSKGYEAAGVTKDLLGYKRVVAM